MYWRFWENAKSVVGSGWVATLGAGQGKTADLVLSAMVRARFCELVSPKIPYGESELFLMGMLSMMDVILEIPMSQVLDNVPIDQEQGSAARRRQPSAPVLSTHGGPRVRRVEDRQRTGRATPSRRKRSRGVLLASHAMGTSGELGHLGDALKGCGLQGCA
jgi:hypothetical protein